MISEQKNAMNDSYTSLDRLHDLALPPGVSWWPLAPGWIALLCTGAIWLVWAAYQSRIRWYANAYRREALSALRSAPDAAAIAKLLRRTALAIAPREDVAAMTGSVWLDWLAARSPVALSETIRAQLTTAVYSKESAPADLSTLRDFAAHWIRSHQA